MSVPSLPVTLTLSTVTATTNGEVRFAEPYLLCVFFKIDGDRVEIVRREDGSLTLRGGPDVRTTVSRHGNVPPIRDGQTVEVPAEVGRMSFELRPIQASGFRGAGALGAAPGVAGVLYVLNEQDLASADAVRAGYRALVTHVTAELRSVLRRVVIDPAAPAVEIRDAVAEALTEHIVRAVKKALLSGPGLGQMLNTDEVLGADMRIFSATSLSADPSQPFTTAFAAGSQGNWRLDGSATAAAPAESSRRRRAAAAR